MRLKQGHILVEVSWVGGGRGIIHGGKNKAKELLNIDFAI